MKSRVLCSIALLGHVLWAPRTEAYTHYGNDGNGCAQCHPGFAGFGTLHQRHVGSAAMTDNCSLCHTQVGDDPELDESAAGIGCVGCHEPFGLRLHHANAGAPKDKNGLYCRNCHPSDGVPPPENLVNAKARSYYLRTDVRVKDPCQAQPAPPGEDFDAGASGLDNDGDLAYDMADSDCAPPSTATPTPTQSATPIPTTTNTQVPTVAVVCVGDCNQDQTVTVDELVTGVNIALGVFGLDRCPQFDKDDSDTVTVDELVTGVNNALTGCP